MKFSQTANDQNVPYLLAKSCVLLVFCVVSTNLLTMAATRATQRRHLLNGDIQDVLHQAMRLTSYHCIPMAIKIASKSPSFLSSPILLSPITLV
jgi:hypothetical protein